MSLLSIALQSLVALIIVAILFIVGYFVFSAELRSSILNATSNKVEVPIISGILDLAQNNNMVYNTQDSSSTSYLPIIRSYNQSGGGEMSYSFWFWKTGDYNPNANTNYGQLNLVPQPVVDSGLNPNDLILILKGSNTVHTIPSICNSSSTPKTKNDVLSKCPLIKFDETTDRLTVEFNLTSNNGFAEEGILENTPNHCADVSMTVAKAKAHKVSLTGFNNGAFLNKWVNIVVVLRDSDPNISSMLANKVQAQIYVNGTLQFDQYVNGSFSTSRSSIASLNMNNDFLYIAPSLVIDGKTQKSFQMKTDSSSPVLKLGDVSYFNYALTADQATAMYARNITHKSGVPVLPPTTATGANPYALSTSKNLDPIFNAVAKA